ncbi:hypothetical protein ACVWZ3_009103 [Bradyrhizobium sp. i1.3.6]
MLIPQADEVEPEAGTCFGSIGTPLGRSSSSGIMFTTIVTHPDAEFAEIRAAKQAK